MYHNRISGLVMSHENQQDCGAGAPASRDDRAARSFLMPVQAADIYQAAWNRAVQDYELDRLFNPEYYDYQI
jgi:hypothetical protein